jgi:hypothetical protein
MDLDLHDEGVHGVGDDSGDCCVVLGDAVFSDEELITVVLRESTREGDMVADTL